MSEEVKQRPRRVRGWVAPALVLLVILFIAAGRVDAALGRIEAPGYRSATWSGLVTLDPAPRRPGPDPARHGASGSTHCLTSRGR